MLSLVSLGVCADREDVIPASAMIAISFFISDVYLMIMNLLTDGP